MYMARTSQLTKIFFPKTNKSQLRPKVGILLALQEAFISHWIYLKVYEFSETNYLHIRFRLQVNYIHKIYYN